MFSRARLDLSVEAARERLLDRVASLSPVDVSLIESLGLTLATDVVAPIDLPRFTNSAMDGVALASAFAADASAAHPTHLRIVGEVDAGQEWDGIVEVGQGVRIGTGALLPDGCDTIIPAEQITERDRIVTLTAPVAVGKHVRFQGEDIKSGTLAIRAGTTLRPQEIGLLAAFGIEHVLAVPRPAVSILSTGPELLSRSATSQVNDTNGPMLAALAETAGAEVVDIVRSDGNIEDLLKHLDDFAATSDLVITSGGISNSLADTMADLLDGHPRAELWEVRLRPGKHFGFAWFEDFALLSLPGNPVAAVVGFELFGRVLIDRLAGKSAKPAVRAIAAESIAGSLGRTDAVRGIAWHDSSGRLLTAPIENRGSGVLSSLPEANCLILLPEDVPSVEPGETAPLQWMGYH